MEHREGPVFFSLTRQGVPNLDRGKLAAATGLRRGAYILADGGNGSPEVIIIATGSEVSVALDARELLEAEGTATRVVSMPSMVLFERQTREYQEEVLPSSVKARVSVEAAGPMGWHRWVGQEGEIVAITHFGASAPAKQIFKELGFTAENVAAKARGLLGRGSRHEEMEAGVGAAGPAKYGVDE